MNIVLKVATTSFLTMSVFLVKASATEIMSEQKARLAAAQMLVGDPYGQTVAEALKRITSSQLVVRGSSNCGTVRAPQWVLHVSVPEGGSNGNNRIEGDLTIDAKSGKMVCAGLPFLD